MAIAPLSIEHDWMAANVVSVATGARPLGSSLQRKLPAGIDIDTIKAALGRGCGYVVDVRQWRSDVDGHVETELVWGHPHDIAAYRAAQDIARLAESETELASFWQWSGYLYGYTSQDIMDFRAWIAPGGDIDPGKCPCPCVQCRPDLFHRVLGW
jgi:hypothetical protein